MNTQASSLFKHMIDSVSQYAERKSLIKQLESLSDHELRDAGIVRDSIPRYVNAVYGKQKPARLAQHRSKPAVFPLRLVNDDCVRC